MDSFVKDEAYQSPVTSVKNSYVTAPGEFRSEQSVDNQDLAKVRHEIQKLNFAPKK